MGLLCTLAFLGCLLLFVCVVSVWDKRAAYQMMKTIDTGVNLAVEPEPEAIQKHSRKTTTPTQQRTGAPTNRAYNSPDYATSRGLTAALSLLHLQENVAARLGIRSYSAVVERRQQRYCESARGVPISMSSDEERRRSS